MRTLPIVYRTLMTMLLISGMCFINVDAFGQQQCTTCSFGSALGTNAVSAGGAVDGNVSGAFGANSSVHGVASFGIGTATVGTPTLDADGSFAIGVKAFSYGDNSFAIGHKVETDSMDEYSYVFGRGLLQTQLVNDISNSIMMGMNSDKPTFFIEGAAGTSGSIGRVGIGTTTPDGILHLKDEADSNSILFIEKGVNNTGGIVWHNGPQLSGAIDARIAFDANEDLYLENRGLDRDMVFRMNDNGTIAEVMRIDGSEQHVGIGTSSPAHKLHVMEDAVTGVAEVMAQFSVSDAGIDQYLRYSNFDATDGEFAAGIIGRNDNPNSGALLLQAQVDNDAVNNTVAAMQFSTVTSGNALANRPSFRWTNGNNVEMLIDANGNVGIGTTSPSGLLELDVDDAIKPGGGEWDAPSDIDLKQDVENFNDGLDVLLQFQPKWFRYNGTFGLPNDERFVGVIAQEVREIAPYMIDTVARRDTLLDVTEDFLSYNGTALTYIIVNSIKEIEQRLVNQDSLEQVIHNLGDQINILQQQVNSCCQNEPAYRYGSDGYVIQQEQGSGVKEFVLFNTDPNPFSDDVHISFNIPNTVYKAEVLVLDMNGALVNRFELQQRGAGSAVFYGSAVSSGTYNCALLLDGKVSATRKMIKK